MRRGPLPIAFYLIPAAAFLAILPLILHGCSCGHDFDFHVVSWMEAAAQFKTGNLHPAWAFSPAWNAGEPRFVFYPPLSWSLGAVLGLALPWNVAPIVFTWLALAAAGFGMYAFARSLEASETASAFASMIYLANPYMLFTSYERTAYAELLAAAWIPLLLAGILRKEVTPLRIALPVALLWLTNAPAAVMACYALAVLALLRLLWLWFEDRRAGTGTGAGAKACAALAGKITSGLVLGLGLAAFYILPAAYERRWVQIAMATIEGMRIQDNFLFHHTADALHDEVLHTASLIAVSMLLAAIVLFATLLFRSSRINAPAARPDVRPTAGPNTHSQAALLLLLALLIGFLLTPASAVIWRFAPEMTFLQFPWRLNAILAAILCAGIAMALSRIHLHARLLIVTSCSLVVVAALVWPSFTVFYQACDEEDTVASRLAVFEHHMGTDPTDEYTTGNADNDALAHTNPPFWLAEDSNAAAPSNGEAPGEAPLHLALQAPRDSFLILNRREFPAWQVRVNGISVIDREERADGLIAIPIHPGRSQIDVSYSTTLDRKLGDGVSILAAFIAIALSLRRRRVPAVQHAL